MQISTPMSKKIYPWGLVGREVLLVFAELQKPLVYSTLIAFLDVTACRHESYITNTSTYAQFNLMSFVIRSRRYAALVSSARGVWHNP